MSRQVCVIVGAGEGLGSALAARFARGGCDLGLVARSPRSVTTAQSAARATDPGARVVTALADAADPDSLEQAFATIAAELGAPDALIYNVRGLFRPCPPLQMSIADLEAAFRLEVIGAFAAARAVLPGMIERRGGTVLFSSATAAFRGSADYPLYAIAKFGVRALSQSLAKAHASDGVHVAHIRIDATLDVPLMRAMAPEADTSLMADTAAIAETYWQVHLQPRSAWSNEVELRPSTEAWTF